MDTPSCIFCDRPAGSIEHVFPDWLRRFAPTLVDGADDAERARLRHEATITIDCVCDTCNRGWMKKLEDTVSTFMKPMMAGEPRTLSARDQIRLRRWAIKTAIMFDALDGHLNASHLLRRELQQGQTPGSCAVLVGHYRGRHLLEHTAAVFSPLDAPEELLTWVTLLAGQVAVYVFTNFTSMRKTASPTEQARRNFALLERAPAGPLQWPPPEPVTDDLVDTLRNGPNKEIRNAPRAHLL